MTAYSTTTEDGLLEMVETKNTVSSSFEINRISNKLQEGRVAYENLSPEQEALLAYKFHKDTVSEKMLAELSLKAHEQMLSASRHNSFELASVYRDVRNNLKDALDELRRKELDQDVQPAC